MVDSLVTRIEEAKTWWVAGAKDLREIIHVQFFYVHCNGFFTILFSAFSFIMYKWFFYKVIVQVVDG
jgi:hypothetical protein